MTDNKLGKLFFPVKYGANIFSRIVVQCGAVWQQSLCLNTMLGLDGRNKVRHRPRLLLPNHPLTCFSELQNVTDMTNISV